MTTHHATADTLTTPPRLRTRRDQEDREAARAANALDAQAEATLRSDPVLDQRATDAIAALSPHTKLRGLAQHALRRLAREHAATRPAAREARALHAQADALYWRMVLGWERRITTESFKLSQRWWVDGQWWDGEEVRSRLLLSWFEAALRYDPERDRAYCRFAHHGAWAKYPEAGMPRPLVRVSPGLLRSYTLVYLEDIAPDPDPDGDEIDLLDRVLVDDAPSPLDEVSDRQILDLVRDCLPVLSSRERFVLDQRHMEGDLTLLDLGKQMRLSRERVRQIERGAIWKLRDALDARGITGHAARS